MNLKTSTLKTFLKEMTIENMQEASDGMLPYHGTPEKLILGSKVSPNARITPNMKRDILKIWATLMRLNKKYKSNGKDAKADLFDLKRWLKDSYWFELLKRSPKAALAWFIFPIVDDE